MSLAHPDWAEWGTCCCVGTCNSKNSPAGGAHVESYVCTFPAHRISRLPARSGAAVYERGTVLLFGETKSFDIPTTAFKSNPPMKFARIRNVKPWASQLVPRVGESATMPRKPTSVSTRAKGIPFTTETLTAALEDRPSLKGLYTGFLVVRAGHGGVGSFRCTLCPDHVMKGDRVKACTRKAIAHATTVHRIDSTQVSACTSSSGIHTLLCSQ